MKTLKGWLTGGILAAVLIFGSTVANAGIIFGATDDGSTQCSSDGGNGGIIFGATGIIFGLTGIIFGSTDTSQCSSAANANGGLLISD